jgi:hypothetical protein
MQRRLGNPDQSSFKFVLGSKFREIGQSLKKILSFALKEKSMLARFTIMLLVFCLGVKVIIVVLIFSETMTFKSRLKISTKPGFNANEDLVGCTDAVPCACYISISLCRISEF